jgi:hypothetical protein
MLKQLLEGVIFCGQGLVIYKLVDGRVTLSTNHDPSVELGVGHTMVLLIPEE